MVEPSRARRADLLAAASFSILLFSANIAHWTLPANDYYFRGANGEACASCLLAIGIVTALVYGLLRGSRGRAARRKGLLILALPATLLALQNLRVATGIGLGLDGAARPLVGVALLAALLFAVRRPERFGRAVHTGFRWSSMVAVLFLLTLVSAPFRSQARTPEGEGGPPTERPPIVWAVFDELDEGWLFDHRPPGLALPEFDRFATEALVCTKAARPGSETLISLPALTLGRAVAGATVASPRDLELRFEDGTRARWSQADTVFDDMTRLGRTSAIDGWYHNYPAVFAGKVRQARTWPYAIGGLWGIFVHGFLNLFPGPVRIGLSRALRFDLETTPESVRQHGDQTEAQAAVLERILHARSADFVFFHCRVPHAPYLRTSKEGYFGNLRVADVMLGRLVRALKAAGTWDGATLLVTSDHNLRKSIEGRPLNELVPLILKLPGQKVGARLDRPVRAIDERVLIGAIAAGRVKTAAQASNFLLDAAARAR